MELTDTLLECSPGFILYTGPDEFATYWNSFSLMVAIPVKCIKSMRLVLLDDHIMPSLFCSAM